MMRGRDAGSGESVATEGGVNVVAHPIWSSIGGQRAAGAPRPSFMTIWNRLGLLSHGGWYVGLPIFVSYVESSMLLVLLIVLSILALPLLVGHIMFYHAQQIKRRRAG